MQALESEIELTQKFGVELECILSVSSTAKDACISCLTDPFAMGAKQLLPLINAHGGKVKRHISPDEEEYDTWIITEDTSLVEYSGRMVGVEIVSPVLSSSDLPDFINFLKDLSKCGQTDDFRAGLHAHIDCRDFSNERIREVVCCFLFYEEQMDALIKSERRGDRCRHARSVAESARLQLGVDKSVAECVALLEEIDVSCGVEGLLSAATPPVYTQPRSARYHKLNLIHCTKPPGDARKRFEFRHHHATTDPNEVLMWVTFLDLFVSRSCEYGRLSKEGEGKGSLLSVLPESIWDFINKEAIKTYYEAKILSLPSSPPDGFVWHTREVCMHLQR